MIKPSLAEDIAHAALKISWFDTESQARRVADHAEELLKAEQARVTLLSNALHKLMDSRSKASMEYAKAALSAVDRPDHPEVDLCEVCDKKFEGHSGGTKWCCYCGARHEGATAPL